MWQRINCITLAYIIVSTDLNMLLELYEDKLMEITQTEFCYMILKDLYHTTLTVLYWANINTSCYTNWSKLYKENCIRLTELH